MASRYSIETIFKAVDKVTGPVSKMQKKVRDLTESFSERLGGLDQKIGVLTGGLRTAATAAVGFATAAVGMGVAATAIAQADVQAQQLAKSVGISVDLMEGLGSAVSSAGFNYENIVDLVEEMNNKLGESAGLEEITPVTESLKILGLRYKDIKKLKPEEQFKKIMNAALKMKDAQKAAAAVDILMGGEANKMLGVLRQQGKTLEEVTASYDRMNFRTAAGRKGAADFAAEMATLTGATKSATSELVGMTGAALVPYMKQLTDWIANNKALIGQKIGEYAQKIADGLAWVVDNMEQIVTWGQRIAIGLGVFIAFVTILKTLILVVTAFNLVLAMNPIGLIVLAVMALVAGLAYLINKFGLATVAGTAVQVAMYAIGAAVLALMGPIGWLIGAAVLIYKNWDVVGPFFAGLWGGILSVFENAKNIIGSVIDWIGGKIDGLLSKAATVAGNIANLFKGDSAAGQAVVNSPAKRAADQITEKRSTSEVVLSPAKGTTATPRGPLGSGVKLKPTGAP